MKPNLLRPPQRSDVQVTLRKLDSQVANYQTFIARGGPVDLHSNGRRLIVQHQEPSGSSSSQNGQAIARSNGSAARDWINEMLDFSSILSRQTQATLKRITNHFKQNGSKFNADFRNHFLYVANNRLMESFDSFLIGLPNEMKSSDCKINRPDAKTYARPNRSIAAATSTALSTANFKRKNSEHLNLLAKRTCPNTVNAIAMASTVQSTRTNVVAAQSKAISKGVRQMASTISAKQVVTASMEAGTSTNSNADDDDVIFCGPLTSTSNVATVNEQHKNSNVLRAHNDIMRRLELLKCKQRRLSVNKPMVSIPKNTLNALASQQQQMVQLKSSQTKTQIGADKATNVGTKINAKGEMLSDDRKRPNDKEELNVTVPVVATAASRGVVTRSGRKTAQTKPKFQCDECDYSTPIRQNLLRHNFVHSGEKPFKCEICEKGFTQKGNLNLHRRTNHKQF